MKHLLSILILLVISSIAALGQTVTGTGTLNYVPKFTGASTIGNSLLFTSGTGIGIGTSSPVALLDIVSTTTANMYLRNGTVGTNWLTSLSQSQIGTYTNHDFVLKTNDMARINILASGNVGIGTTNIADPSFKLFVETGIRTRKVKVDAIAWPDYVFNNNYNLLPLAEVEKFLNKNKHLPDVPSAAEVTKEGVDLGDNQTILLKKIEELTLYMIDQNKKMERQGEEINDLKKQLNLLQKTK